MNNEQLQQLTFDPPLELTAPNVDALHAPPEALAMEDSDGIPVYPARGAVTASQRTSAELSRIMIRQEQRKQRVDERAEAIAKSFKKAQADGRTRTRAFRRHERHLIRQTFGISPDTSDDDAGEETGVLSGGEEAGDGEEETGVFSSGEEAGDGGEETEVFGSG
ncbi:hypothetical protein PF001_g26902 [Phytophthora fragariae]|uniref:Uncharacterized protein n=4 Tax=Phytophthora fragariae TaxID=53985 RepID=A0A6A4BLQ9_9STRA|nr:hypothetical protein PF001_g26902 [Phytophthora fragariae]